MLFDPKGAWEKPCGGGVTSRALREFTFLLDSSNHPKQVIRKIKLVSPSGSAVRLAVDRPFAVYSRRVLNGLVLDRATHAGARFLREVVTGFERDRDGWIIKSEATNGDKNLRRVKLLVGADGAASSLRRKLLGIFPKDDLALAFGYNVTEEADTDDIRRPGADEVVVRFPRHFTGYLWAFPRPGAMNFGVASKLGDKTSDKLRAILLQFVRDYYDGEMPGPERATFFGAKIPTLDASSWKELRATGDAWALVGDAAGFCDPITGEGIYYALKSAQLLAGSLTGATGHNYGRAMLTYEQRWRDEFGRELEKAAQILPRFYRGYLFGQIFTDAMVRSAKVHRGCAKILTRALTGQQSYVTLKQDLLKSAWRVI
jgi:flavin-dependent dehydrogenase